MTVNTKVARMKYNSQLMHEFFARWEPCSAQLALMAAPMDQGLLVAMHTESFGNNSKLLYGVNLSVSLKKKGLTWQTIVLRLLQEYNSQKATKSASFPSKESMYVASSSNNKDKRKRRT